MRYVKLAPLLMLFLLSVAMAPAAPSVSVDQHRGTSLPGAFGSGPPATIDVPKGPPTRITGVTHWALIVGISDYKAISDLNFCDDDANDWYAYLAGLGYEHIIVLGDHTNVYTQYDGLATEINVKTTLQYIVNTAAPGDTVAFISSGHGSGDSRGSSLLCMWDASAGESGEDGYLWDYELAAILSSAVAENIFVFLDHCFSGGFGDDLMAMPNAANVYVAVTCDVMGMGWDSAEYSNGLWTYFFLEYTLIGVFDSDPNTSMESAFDVAESAYPYRGGAHHPQEYDGDTANLFYLW
ncbi:MAG: caspase family protein [Candidatus Thorarchaeota archaeon]